MSLRPKVIVAGAAAQLVLRPAGAETAVKPLLSYTVRVFSKVNRTEDTRIALTADEQGALRIPARLSVPGECEVLVFVDGAQEPIAREVFFTVAPEIARLRPFKGDLHMHTTGSDGTATAAAMAARARQVGHDFIAITDHDNYAPSGEAMAAAAEAGLDLLVLPGEEVTVRDIGGHILSLGASAGVGTLRHRPDSDAERRDILDHRLAGRRLVHPLTAEQYAHAVWTVQKIRQFGGLAILAHPYWVGTTEKYYPPRCLVDQLMADRLCDGVEVFGGSPTTEGNRLSIASHARQAATGQWLPVTGGSDAHRPEDIGARYWTIAFCDRLDAASILRAITDGRTVACDAAPGGEVTIYGHLDLVEYAYFLHREYFPLHDRACAAGGSRAQVDAACDGFW